MTKTLTYSVPAMSCGHCVSSITSEVQKVAGVADVIVDLDTKTVVVNAAPDASIDDAAIRAAIDEAGFEPAT